MTLNEYQGLIQKFAIYPDALSGNVNEALYLALGLVDESGEVAGKIKKLYRDGNINKEELAKELGDVFWYLSRLSEWAGFDAEYILKMNYSKLSSRMDRGKLGGSGDNR